MRLRRATDFEAVFKKGRRSADRFFTVLYCPSGVDHARLGMTTPAKRLRTAVSRNRIRRLVRESFRNSAARLAGLDVVVMAREATVEAGNIEIFASLDQHWGRLQRTATESGARA